MISAATLAALLGSVCTALAIFGGGLAVERYKHRRERVGVALALAGAIDAMLSLIAVRGLVAELEAAADRLHAGETIDLPTVAAMAADNPPFLAIAAAHHARLGDLGGDLPFRVARFLCFEQGLRSDLARLHEMTDPASRFAAIVRMEPLWRETHDLGEALVRDLRNLGASGPSRPDRPPVSPGEPSSVLPARAAG